MLFEALLTELGAMVCSKDNSQTMLIRFDILISALKVHSYSYGDMTILEEQMSHRDNSSISVESREILKALAEKGKKSL